MTGFCEFVWKDEAAKMAVCSRCHRPATLRRLDTTRRCLLGAATAAPTNNADCGGCKQQNPAPAQNKPLPSLPRQARNFAGAITRDLAGGRARRTAEQVARIFRGSCDLCEWYNRVEQACSHADCGCPLSAKIIEGERNKLTWVSEECPDKPPKWPYPAIEKRNLIFYVLPLRHSLKVWQWHVEQLRRYLPLFNGRKIVTIATKGEGEGLAIEPAELVREAFGEDASGIEFLERPNYRSYWETPAFREMLGMLAPGDPNEATFYFHAKGVRRAEQNAIRLWCQEIYRHNLGRVDGAMEALRYWKACGVARSPTTPGKMDVKCGWHYAGTGFWFRHDALFAEGAPPAIHDHSHAVEGFLGTQFRSDEVYCLAHDNVGSVYDEATWQRAIAEFDAADGTEKVDPKTVKVSIIVTARNYGRYLREALDSALAQDLPAHEVLYMDDGSQDESVAIARSIAGVTVFELPHRPGVIIARNTGAGLATGNAFVFLDGDDMLPPEYLSKTVARLRPSTPFVYSDTQNFGDDNRFVRQPDWGPHDLRKANICHSSSLIWAAAFREAGGWMMGDFGRMPDWHLFLRLAQLGEPRRAAVALHYRKHGQSWSDQARASETPERQADIRRQILASVDEWTKGFRAREAMRTNAQASS